jgi:hypothetical protein
MASMGNAQRGALGGLAKLGEGARTTSDLSRVGGGLSRGANEGKKLNAAPWSDTWPAAGATLDLDFANNRGFVRGVGQGGVMDAITFTRASNGNFVKPDGTLSTHANQGALGNNLLSFPQNFDNSYWTKTGTTVVENSAIAPDDKNNANLLTDSSASTEHSVVRSNVVATVGETYTFSAYIKDNGIRYAGLSFQSGNAEYIYIIVDLTDGVVTQTGTLGVTGQTYSVTSANNGYWRLSVTFNTPRTLIFPFIFLSNTGTPSSFLGGRPLYVGTGLSAFIWGAQLEVGSTATEYFPTNIGEPRFDWASTEQVARQNNILYTQDFGNVYWPKTTGAVTTDTTTAPDGTMTADLYIPAASSSNAHRIFKDFGTATQPTTTAVSSFYLKPSGYRYVSIVLNDTDNQVKFDLQDGVAGFVGTSIATYSITAESNGFYRVSISSNTPTNHRFLGVIILPDGTTFNTQTLPTWTPDGTSGIYIWGAQRELGSNPTAYIENGAQLPTSTPLAANPTSNGILIEEARTNRLLWNRDATQTEWVKTNITAAKDQTGIDGVANAASSLTATDDNGTCIQTITLAAGNRTGSVYLKRLTGAGLIQVTLDGSTYSTVELSDTEWYRIVLSGSVTNPTVGIKIAVDGDAVAMDYGQVEDGLSVSTPILTTTSTATRAVDSATRFIDDGLNVNGMTAYAEFVTTGLLQTTTNSIVVGFGSAVNNNPQASVISYRNDNFATGHNPRNIDASIGVKNTVSVTFAFASGNSYYIFEGATNGETPSDLRAGLNSSNLIVAPLNKIGIGNPGRGTGNISTIGTMTISRVALFTKQSNTNTLQELTK